MNLVRLLVLSALLSGVLSVDRGKFRTCDQTAFCKRLRKGDSFVSQDYELAGSLNTDNSQALLTVDLKNGRHPLQDALECKVQILKHGVVRMSVREKRPKHPRWEVKDVLQADAITPHGGVTWKQMPDDKGVIASFGQTEVHVTRKPFSVVVTLKGVRAIAVNSQGMMTFEQLRDRNPKTEAAPATPPPTDAAIQPEGAAPVTPPAPTPVGDVDPKSLKFPYDTPGMWEETFQTHTDSKPRGPAAVALDVSFLGSEHVYGIPEHASSFALKSTGKSGAYSDPYRLFNLDVFEYELDNPMSLYGAVPFLISHDHDKTTGMLWLNSAETYIDVADGKDQSEPTASGGLLSSLFQVGNPKKDTHWMSESGVIDLFLFTGPGPKDVLFQYATLTGFAALPQRFATAYHQCRWNYKSEEDVRDVDANFDVHDIPYDVMWLDIEHTDGKKYFTWDRVNFPNPADMQRNLASKGRKMVTIVDPHIKRESGYKVHTSAQKRDLYIRNPAQKGGEYEGWCWPGSVSYLDFLLPEVREYWAGLFSLSEYEGSTDSLYTWNDMNEPSVFNGPEVTMPKDCLHDYGTVEHRDVHNLYGFYVQMATDLGHRKRDNARPFVLTRAFFSGSQQYGAVWTGDNKADWSHLAAAQPMLLSMNIAGITFSGADVGGFFGDPDPELLVRWYQAAAFHPFFRGHAHIDTKRREPWLFGEPYTTMIRDAIRTRYTYLPYIYTLFHYSSVTGIPIMRPLWLEFPLDKDTYAMEDQFMLGDALLIKPIVTPKTERINVYLPGTQPWYDVKTYQQFAGEQTLAVSAPQNKIPVFQRGGSIIAKRERARRSSVAMENDPFTLVVALDTQSKASGMLYLDDGRTFEYQRGVFAHRSFSFQDDELRSQGTAVSSFAPPAVPTALSSSKAIAPAAGQYVNDNTVERVVIWGLKKQYTKAVLHVSGKQPVELTISAVPGQLVVRKPDAPITGDWSIKFS